MKTFRSEATHPLACHTCRALALAAVLVGGAARMADAQTPAPSDDAAAHDPNVAEARTAFREATSLARQAQWGEVLKWPQPKENRP